LEQDKKIELGKIQGMERFIEYSQGKKEVCGISKEEPSKLPSENFILKLNGNHEGS
jgi:hypothetical protein